MAESLISVRHQKIVMVSLLIVGDILMVSLALWGAIAGYSNATVDSNIYAAIVMLAAFGFLGIFVLQGLYDQNDLFGGTKEYGLVFQSCTYGVVILVAVRYFYQDLALSPGWILIGWLYSVIGVSLMRFLMRRLFFFLRRSSGWFIQKTLLVGVSEHAIQVAEQIQAETTGIRIVGFLDEFLPTGSNVVDNLIVLGTPDQIHELAAEYQVDQVVLFANAVSWETFRTTIQKSGYKHGFRLNLSPGFYEILTSNFIVTHQAQVPLLKVEPARIRGGDRIVKTLLDYLLGSILFLIFLPINLLIMSMLYFSAGRPIFIQQQVLGLNGEIFSVRKFRTGLFRDIRRRLDDPDLSVKLSKIDFDTPLLRFLFLSGLDKLPQLWSVLLGKLSLVGPRANSPGYENAPGQGFHPSLLTVKPGWTGPWAVWGAYTVLDEKKLNLHYIRNWTIWADLQILFQTFRLALYQLIK